MIEREFFQIIRYRFPNFNPLEFETSLLLIYRVSWQIQAVAKLYEANRVARVCIEMTGVKKEESVVEVVL